MTKHCVWCGSEDPCDCRERISCPDAGKPRHRFCGICELCGDPRFVCSCGGEPKTEESAEVSRI